jgi:antitoxin component of MazEF toxin-antitoxin module
MTRATIAKWDDDLAVRLPGEIVRAVELRDGENVEIEERYGDIIIRRPEPPVTLEDMFDGKSPAAWRLS